MKRMILTILFSVIFAQLAFAAEEKLPDVQNTEQNTEEDFILPNIFIFLYSADLYETDTTSENKVEDNILYEQETFPVRYDDSSVARYDLSQDWDEVIELSDIQDKKFNLSTQYNSILPVSTTLSDKILNKSVMPNTYRREEYNIMPLSKNEVERIGNFQFGTLYKSGIDTSQLEYNAGLFTRYERSKFAISTAYQKNQMTTYGLTTTNFYLVPEFKLNNSVSISNILKADTTRNRRSSELVLTIKPFASKGNDRVNLEFGAGQTYDENNALFKTQFRFNTRIQL